MFMAGVLVSEKRGRLNNLSTLHVKVDICFPDDGLVMKSQVGVKK